MTPTKIQDQRAQSVTQIAIPQDTFTRLARAAQAEHLSVEQLAGKIIREHLLALEQKEMQREMDAYAAQHAQILQKYRGEYIAMYHGEIVDHDKDITTLLTRIDEHFPDATLLLKQVQEQIADVLTIPSFRFVSE